MRLMMKFIASATFSFLFLFNAFAQERPLGTWKSFMPYSNAVAICDAGDKVYSAANKSVFSYEKSTGIIQFFDKSTGLNDIGIKTIN